MPNVELTGAHQTARVFAPLRGRRLGAGFDWFMRAWKGEYAQTVYGVAKKELALQTAPLLARRAGRPLNQQRCGLRLGLVRRDAIDTRAGQDGLRRR